MNDELKPCPFCGSTDLRIHKSDTHLPVRFVMCNNKDCNTEGPTDLGESGAIEKWNSAPRKVANKKPRRRVMIIQGMRNLFVHFYEPDTPRDLVFAGEYFVDPGAASIERLARVLSSDMMKTTLETDGNSYIIHSEAL